MLNADDLIKSMKNLVDSYEAMKTKGEYAKSHILDHVNDFTEKELECMAMDGIIKYEEIPEHKRTDHAKFMFSLGSPGKEISQVI